MSKGGGVDTSGVSRQVGLMDQFAQQAAAMGLTNYETGVGLQKAYGDPTWQALLQMSGYGPGGAGQYVDPALAKFMQPVYQQGQQAAGAATRDLMGMGLGPIATQTAKQQIDLQRMANTQQGALALQQWVAQQLGQVGTQGLTMQGQAPSALLGAGQVAGQAGSLESQMVQQQVEAQAAGNLGLASIFKTIGTLGGLALGGPLGGAAGGFLGGLFGGGGGAGAGYVPGYASWSQQTGTPGGLTW